MFPGDTTGGGLSLAVCLCLLCSTLPGVYVIVAAEILTAFGPGHFEAIFGLYYSHYLLYMVLSFSLKVRLVKFSTAFNFYFQTANIGYEGTFCVAGAIALIGLIVVLIKKK